MLFLLVDISNTVPLPSSRRYISSDCLEDKSEDYQNCSVLYCVTQLCTIITTVTPAVLTGEVGLEVQLIFVFFHYTKFVLAQVFVYFLSVVVSLVDCTSETDCLKRLVSEMT